MKVILQQVSGEFMYAVEPKAGQTEEGKATSYWRVALPIVPNSDNHKRVVAALEAICKEKWKDKWKQVLALILQKNKSAYQPRPITNKAGDVYEGFEGCYSLNAGRNAEKKPAPQLFDYDMVPMNETALKAMRSWIKAGKFQPVKDQLRPGAESKFYPGGIYNIAVDLWAQDEQRKNIGTRINCDFLSAQWVAEGTPRAMGAQMDSDDFQDYSLGDADSMSVDLLGEGSGTEDDALPNL